MDSIEDCLKCNKKQCNDSKQNCVALSGTEAKFMALALLMDFGEKGPEQSPTSKGKQVAMSGKVKWI